jgi:hypothetical protein
MTSTEFSVGASDRANKILAFDTNGELAVTQELGTFRGNWATATSYFARDLVKDTSTNNIFIVDTAHTSSGSQPLTTNANSAFYELIVDAASASTSATAAAASAATATTQATNAASSASAASSSASAASSSASSASSAVTAAQAAQAAAELALDNFDDIYLGAFATNPTLDNDGGALTAGDLYFNTASSALQVYSGSAWQAAAVSTAGFATLTGTETFTNKTLTSPIIGTAITLNATAELRLADTDSSNYVGFKSPGTVSTNKIWTLPSADGSANQALTTNGSGVLSFADAGRTGAVNWDTTPKTTTVTAVSGNGYFVNTTSGTITVNLPAGVAGAIVAVSDYANTAATNNIIIDPNGTDKINGINSNYYLATNGVAVTLIYVDATRGWKDINDATLDAVGLSAAYITATGGTVLTCGDFKSHVFTGPGTFCVSSAGNFLGSNSVEYLVVAGGGGAGQFNRGGGGAGGYRQNYPSPTSAGLPVTAQGYPITVGGGGATTVNGNPSIFSSITSAGGGGARSTTAPTGYTGVPGGSGSGAGSGTSADCGATPLAGGTGNTPPVSPSQGNPGGASIDGYYFGTIGSGGGGAGAAGGAANPLVWDAGPKTSGSGGVGSPLATTFFGPTAPSYGTPGPAPGRYFAGGGAGTSNFPPGAHGTGGSGGGGPGIYPGTGTSGTTNTGGGGGSASGSGGSGIVVIRYKFQ